jgi:sec-independent protein translocase protein TatA
MELSLSKLLIVLLIVLLVFGAGKLPQVMGEFGKGIRSLKEGLKDEAKDKKPEEITTIVATPAATPVADRSKDPHA